MLSDSHVTEPIIEMEGSSGASNIGNEAQSQKLQVQVPQTLEVVKRDMELLENEKQYTKSRKELIKHVNHVFKDTCAIWEVVLPKHADLYRLYAENLTVSNKFREYSRLWRRRRYFVSANIESYHRFMEIKEQTQLLSRMMDEYQDKLRRAGEIIEGFIRDLESCMKSLQQCIEEIVFQARTLRDLGQIRIPTLDLDVIERIPDPGIEILAAEWKEMELDLNISHCLNLLRMFLLQPEQ